MPTPAVILDRAIVQRNCDAMLNACAELGVGFRPHVKSHKACAMAGCQGAESNLLTAL